MSEFSRGYHSRSTDTRNDRHSDNPMYRETQHEHDRDRGVASHHDTFENEYGLHSDQYDTRDHASHSAVNYDENRGDYLSGNTEQNIAESEEVWLKEKLSIISYNDHDLQDIERARHSTLKRTIAGFAGLTGILGLIGFLAVSSAPDLSPEEIIAMEGYAGEQSTKTPFNLASLRDCDTSADCSKAAKTEIVPITAVSAQTLASVSQDTSGSRHATPTVPATEIYIARNNSETIGSFRENFREIPAAVATILTVTESEAADSATTRSQDYTDSDLSISDLVVLQQWSNVRGAPELNGEILTSLAKGTNVTGIGQTGKWIKVKVIGRKQVTGYMHQSTVGQI